MNLPNKISLARILLIPVFVAVFFLDGILPFAFGIAAIIFAVAACTDFVDGKIARSRGLVTNLGKFLDPIADKVLVSTAMIVILTMKDSLFALFGGAANALYVHINHSCPHGQPSQDTVRPASPRLHRNTLYRQCRVR